MERRPIEVEATMTRRRTHTHTHDRNVKTLEHSVKRRSRNGIKKIR